jgi:protein gp37
MKSFQDIHWHKKDYNRTFPDGPSMIFVGATGDISFWDTAWVDATLEKIKLYPQHIFIFLTKKPNIYLRAIWDFFPKNCWFGASALNGNEVSTYQDHLFQKAGYVRFLSIEPIEEEINIDLLSPDSVDWIILGGQSGPGEKFYPNGEWVGRLWEYTRRHDIALFVKDNFRMKTNNGIKSIKEVVGHIREWPEAKE